MNKQNNLLFLFLAASNLFFGIAIGYTIGHQQGMNHTTLELLKHYSKIHEPIQLICTNQPFPPVTIADGDIKK